MMQAPFKPTLSIVTINLNNALGLERTIKSLQNSRKSDSIEYIFVDGKSSDRSMSVALDFYSQDEIICEADDGIYDAMNKGLSRARGEYVLWLNSGDEMLPNGWQHLVNHANAGNASVITFGIECVSHIDSKINVIKPDLKKDIPGSSLPHPSTIFRRKHVVELGGYDTRWQIVGDRDLILRFFYGGYSFKAIPEVVSRFYGGGISSTTKLYSETVRLRLKHGHINYLQYLLRQPKCWMMENPLLWHLVKKPFPLPKWL